MPTTWIEVADSATKIGLGAIIGGLSSLLLASTSHRQTISREIIAKKFKLLEVGCEEAEKFFSYSNRLYNRVSAFARENNLGERDQTEAETQFIIDSHDGLEEAIFARNKALAHISLFGSEDALQQLNLYSDALERYRTLIAYRERMPSNEQHQVFIREFQSIKKSFYSACRSALDKIGSPR